MLKSFFIQHNFGQGDEYIIEAKLITNALEIARNQGNDIGSVTKIYEIEPDEESNLDDMEMNFNDD